MSIIKQSSRISHHTTTDGASFSVPTQEDFTLPIGASGSWDQYDLALSEIGVDEFGKRVFIRVNDEIKEFVFTGTVSNCCPLDDTLSVGNTTGNYNIVLSDDTPTTSSKIEDETGENFIRFVKKSSEVITLLQASTSSTINSSISLKDDEVTIRSKDVSGYGNVIIKPDSINIETSQLGTPVNIQNVSNYRYSLITTDATPTDVFTFSIPSGIRYFEVDVTGGTNVYDEGYYSNIISCVRSQLGTLYQVGSIDQVTKTDFATTTTTMGITSSYVYLEITGEAAKTINWKVNLKYR